MIKKRCLLLGCLILLLSGCSLLEASPVTTESPPSSAASAEAGETRDTSMTRIYRFHIIDPDSGLAENGLFVAGITGEEKLLVNLGQNFTCNFIEDDYLYCVGINLVCYDLLSSDPDEPISIIQILPDNTEVQRLCGYDDEQVRVYARMWNSDTHMHNEASYYSAKRDGTGYYEIGGEEDPGNT